MLNSELETLLYCRIGRGWAPAPSSGPNFPAPVIREAEAQGPRIPDACEEVRGRKKTNQMLLGKNYSEHKNLSGVAVQYIFEGRRTCPVSCPKQVGRCPGLLLLGVCYKIRREIFTHSPGMRMGEGCPMQAKSAAEANKGSG